MIKKTAVASEHFSLGPAPQFMTPGTLSPGLWGLKAAKYADLQAFESLTVAFVLSFVYLSFSLSLTILRSVSVFVMCCISGTCFGSARFRMILPGNMSNYVSGSGSARVCLHLPENLLTESAALSI
ncbi:hypothetical protein Tco_1019536 [Tanacetum coccineum]|uniref:Uncharacterized protein n=1 Tax=Tanacetum coccineum TaxID=301880 RepID=A0ABQ5FXE6_9ASTR